MSKKGASLQKDAPWRASAAKIIPKIHHSPVLRLPQTDHSNYSLAVMKHADPIGNGLAIEAIVEAAGPECIVPCQIKPIRLLGLKVWPIEVNMKFMEPVYKELKLLGKVKKTIVLDALLSQAHTQIHLLACIHNKEQRFTYWLAFTIRNFYFVNLNFRTFEVRSKPNILNMFEEVRSGLGSALGA